MMQYLVILLDDTSVSYCHCDNPYTERRLIPMEVLREGILYAMKQNLMIQFVYPDYDLPQEYLEAIDSIDHHDIVPAPREGDVQVLSSHSPAHVDGVCVLRLSKEELFASEDRVSGLLRSVQRLNVVITDVEHFCDADLPTYSDLLGKWAAVLKEEYLAGRMPQLNLLTDRMMLTKRNHCNAGVENVTLAPNGHFYLCPAFYFADPDSSIDPSDIKNRQLLQVDHAPLCRHCDALHCRRCVWLNQKSTLDINTPSHEQCIVAHTEREASRQLLEELRQNGVFMPEVQIEKLNYNDPFEVRKQW